MKFALIQKNDSPEAIRVIEGKIARNAAIGSVAFVNSPSAVWEFLCCSEGWENLDENEVKDNAYFGLATKTNEAFARMIYRVPEDVELYTESEIRNLLPIKLSNAEAPTRFCFKL